MYKKQIRKIGGVVSFAIRAFTLRNFPFRIYQGHSNLYLVVLPSLRFKFTSQMIDIFKTGKCRIVIQPSTSYNPSRYLFCSQEALFYLNIKRAKNWEKQCFNANRKIIYRHKEWYMLFQIQLIE